jgi:hypothetical protein
VAGDGPGSNRRPTTILLKALNRLCEKEMSVLLKYYVFAGDVILTMRTADFFIQAQDSITEDQEAIEPIVGVASASTGYMNPYIQLEEKSMDEHQ